MMGPSVKDFVKNLVTGGLDLLFPPHCVLCRCESAEPLCSNCLQKFTLLTPPFCKKCGYTAEGGPTRCRQCRDFHAFDQARSAGWYEDALRDAIHHLKYKGQQRLALPLAHFLAESPAVKEISAEIIIPVPLHRSRLRSRGYNQSELIANEFGALIDRPVFKHVLVRQRATPPQVGQTAIERYQSIRGAFAVHQPELIKDKSIILIDDVYTTGSTLSEASRVLKANGASHVIALSLSRDR